MNTPRRITPFVPDSILPSQLTASRRPSAGPEMRLVAALFEDALRVISRGPRTGLDARSARDFDETCDWFLSRNREWPFAFANVCDLLGLDARAVRQKVYATIAQSLRGTSDPAEAHDHVAAPLERQDRPHPPDAERHRFEIVEWDEV